jgi:hypothetical protein
MTNSGSSSLVFRSSHVTMVLGKKNLCGEKLHILISQGRTVTFPSTPRHSLD